LLVQELVSLALIGTPLARGFAEHFIGCLIIKQPRKFKCPFSNKMLFLFWLRIPFAIQNCPFAIFVSGIMKLNFYNDILTDFCAAVIGIGAVKHAMNSGTEKYFYISLAPALVKFKSTSPTNIFLHQTFTS